jgi:hypothetical protein
MEYKVSCIGQYITNGLDANLSKKSSSDEPDKIGFDIFKRGKVKYAAGSVYAAQTIHGGAGIWPVNTKCATVLPGLYAD